MPSFFPSIAKDNPVSEADVNQTFFALRSTG
jgi:hypothetical protein